MSYPLISRVSLLFFIVYISLSLVSVSSTEITSDADNCNPKLVGKKGDKLVCQCDVNTCKGLKFEWPQESGEAYIVETTKSGKRFKTSRLNEQEAKSSDAKLKEKFITINLKEKFEPILGWGGAFTDATGANLRILPEALAEKLIESYYGEDGLHYTIGRIPIAGTDFSKHAYSYDDTKEPDYELNQWHLSREDLELKIPYAKRACKLVSARGEEMKLFASSWSPPKWMKTKWHLVQGTLKSDNRTQEAYAHYLIKFFQAYEMYGLKFWGATLQNEPGASYLPIYFFNSLQLSKELQIKFIAEHLGPMLVKYGYTKDKFKLMIGDDSLGFVNHQVPAILKNTDVQKYVSGVAFHWYVSGPIVSYNKLNKLYEQVKDKIEFLMMSEACTGSMPGQSKVSLGSWGRGESYAMDIIQDLNRHTSSWIDWNLALDLQGGPNWSKNFVDSPIIVDGEKKEFYKQPMYYAIAHFSRFFRPGSIRVASKLKRSWGLTAGTLHTVSVHDEKSNHLIVNILNKSTKARKIHIKINDSPLAEQNEFNLPAFVIEGKSFNTVVLKL